MNNSIGKYYAASGFRAVKVCFPRRKLAFRRLALCFGLIFVAGLVLLRQHGGCRDCSAKFTVPADYFGNKSVGIMHQRVEDSCKGLSSEIPCYCKHVKLAISLRETGENDFQPVEVRTTAYVYSAYLDDRVTPDVDPKALPVVRIFTVLQRDMYTVQALKNWRCLFWYEMVDLPLVMPVVAFTNLDVKDLYHRFLARMVLCSLPTNLTSSTPSAVSLVSNICASPLNYLPVTDLRKRRRNFERSSSYGSNTFSWNENKVSNFTICVPPIFGDYMKTLEIIEFIELNRLLGADKFVFYLESPKPELVSCLWYYSKLGLVELNSFVLPFEHENVFYHGQILAQNECLFRVMYRTRYAINQDTDEFIVPTRTTDWTTMLDLIHKNKQYGEADRLATYNFRNLFFRMQEPNDLSVEEPFIVNGYELKTLTKTLCSDKSDPWKERSKVMGRPERLIIWHVHEIYYSSLVRKGDVNALIDDGDGLLFHYREIDYQRYPNYTGNTINRQMWRHKRHLFANVASRARSYGCRA